MGNATKSKRIWGTLDPFLESGPVLGRKVANTGFITALLQADPFDGYHFYLGDHAAQVSLESLLRRTFPKVGRRVSVRPTLELPRALAAESYHCFHLSDCFRHQPHLVRLRNARSATIFPITAPIHSLSYATYAHDFLPHLWAGVTPRDAIVATSRAGAEAVERFFAGLRAGYGLDETGFPGPALRRIPLGVDPGELTPAGPDERRAARAELGIDPEALVVLVFGRIAHYSKMDILPLLRAFQRVLGHGEGQDEGGELRGRVHLLLAGWADHGDTFPQSLTDMARNIGLSAGLVARPETERKRRCYQAADLFVSIADNPQETFGLTLLEAQSAGLPVIASDYDGYRDLVDPGVTGLLVPTLGPGPEGTADVDELAPLLFDNQYHLLLAQRTAVEVPALAEALTALLAGPDAAARRAAMGAAGRERVLANYTWAGVVAQYVALWEELSALPADPPRNAAHPLHVAYGRTFAHYATRTLTPETRLAVGALGAAFQRGRDFPLIYPGVAHLVDEAALRALVVLARRPIPAADLARKLAERAPGLAPQDLDALLLWALKHDLLERSDP
ncbi:MAG: glycosyltransferase family 4 protein [Desulfovibrionaceae bacterium]